MPKVSVIIPCYNAEEWLVQCLNSVIAQTYKHVEIVVVDDGSTDSTAEILRRYRDKLHVYRQDNAGVSAARNYGVSKATGDFIRFVDSDDVLPSAAIESMVSVLDNQKNMVCIGRADQIDDGNVVFEKDGYCIYGEHTHKGLIKSEYLCAQATHSGIFLIPRAAFSIGVRFDPEIRLGEEYTLAKQLISHGYGFLFCDRVVYYVRSHGSARLSRSGLEADYVKQLACIKECVSVCTLSKAGQDLDGEAKLAVAKSCWSLGRHCFRAGYFSAGNQYIEYARKLCGNSAIVGSYAYRKMACLIEASSAECLVSGAKQLGEKIKGFYRP